MYVLLFDRNFWEAFEIRISRPAKSAYDSNKIIIQVFTAISLELCSSACLFSLFWLCLGKIINIRNLVTVMAT